MPRVANASTVGPGKFGLRNLSAAFAMLPRLLQAGPKPWRACGIGTYDSAIRVVAVRARESFGTDGSLARSHTGDG